PRLLPVGTLVDRRLAGHAGQPRDPRAGGRLCPRHATRRAGPRQVHARALAGRRARVRLGDHADRRHRRRVLGPRNHPRRGVPDDGPRRPAARPGHRGRGHREAPPHARGLERGRPGQRTGAITVAESVAASPPVALYVHVPFCVSHCPYCDFVVVAGREARGPSSRIEAFVGALETELRLRADALDERWGVPPNRPPLASLYLGGGTPSLLPSSTIAQLVDLVHERFGLAADAEVTLEVNPGADERGDAAAQREAGVTRLSIGAQSFDTGELRRLGRRHDPDDIVRTVAAARAAG